MIHEIPIPSVDLPNCKYCGNHLVPVNTHRPDRFTINDAQYEIAYNPNTNKGEALTAPDLGMIFWHETMNSKIIEKVKKRELVEESFYLFRCSYKGCGQLRNKKELPMYGIQFNFKQGELEKIIELQRRTGS